MKKFLFVTLMLFTLMIGFAASAAEIGDFYYSDKSFSSDFTYDKKAIGIVYWVSPKKDYGLIASLDQPTIKNWQKSMDYCEKYKTVGTKAGDWFIPSLADLTQTQDRGRESNSDRLEMLNKKLKAVSQKYKFDKAYYWSSSAFVESRINTEQPVKADSRDYAWAVDMSTDRVSNILKIYKCSVRCMMAF